MTWMMNQVKTWVDHGNDSGDDPGNDLSDDSGAMTRAMKKKKKEKFEKSWSFLKGCEKRREMAFSSRNLG